MFTYLNLITYLLLALVWAGIMWFSAVRMRYRSSTSPFFVSVLFILMLDAGRTIIESIYFGIRNLSMAAIIDPSIFRTLNQPEYMVIPKAINLAVAILIGTMLYRRWLPMQEADQRKAEQYLKELEEKTVEQESTAKALRESEQRFRMIIEASPMGVHQYELDKNDQLIFTGANPAADAILGIKHDSLIGKTIDEAFPSLTYTQIPNSYRALCRDGGTWHSENLHYDDTNVAGTFELHAFQTSPGQMAVQFSDITQRKQAEEALSMAQYTLDHAAIGILWIRMNGDILYANQAASDLFGYDRDEMPIMRIDDLTTDISIRDLVLQRIREKGSTTFEAPGLRKDGTQIPMEVTSHYIQFGEQEFEFIFAADLTEKKEVEQTLARLNQELETLVEKRTSALEQTAGELRDANLRLTEVDRMKSAMLSTVTHELKTPLTSIIGYTKLTDRDFLRDFLPLAAGNASLTRRGQRIGDNLSIIGKEGARLLTLIDNFLALSRIRAEAACGDQRPMDLKKVIEKAVYLSQSYFSAQPDITLAVDMAEDLPTIHADPDGILQVLINLLDNAAKFGGQGEATLKARRNEDKVEITVSDSGPGIPKKERHKVFEPFYQICEDEECTIKPAGTGVGLAICKQVAENCGGNIRLVCPESGGCEFILELPVEKAPANR